MQVEQVGDAGVVTLTLTPGEYYLKTSDAWAGELVALDRVVRREIPDSLVAAEGSKGDLLTGALIVQILSSTGVGALLGCVKSWIQAHPGRRTLEMSWTDNGHENHLVINANNVDDETLQAAVVAALKRDRR
jgi:hypothetical protein